MKHASGIVALGIALLFSSKASVAQVSGATTIDVNVAVTQGLVFGLSAKRQVIDQRVYNENGEAVGRIDDLIVAPDDAVSFGIVGAGGFVGLRRHQVAIPINLLAAREVGFTLAGAAKAAIKSLRGFEYTTPLDRAITRNPVFHR